MRPEKIWLMAAALLLCGCVPLQQKIQKERIDRAHYDAQARERAAARRCNEVAVPGSTDHMTCRLGLPGAAAEK